MITNNLSPNPKHKKIIDRGVESWNKWRRKNPTIEPELQGISLRERDLRGIDLKRANLQSSDLSYSTLTNAQLAEADLEGSLINMADCEKASFFGANLQGADPYRVNLRNAILLEANLRDASLREANIKGADLRGAIFIGTNVTMIKYNRWAKYRSIRLNGCFGSPRFKRFAEDQEFIEELRAAWWRKPIYWLWLVFADCGRSMILWATWSVLSAGLFGAIYSGLHCKMFNYLPWIPEWFKNLLVDATPVLELPPSATWFTPYYFSIVTFTTLGFGDVTPTNLAGEIWVTAEVILGYVMLGGLISIFSTKLARRA